MNKDDENKSPEDSESTNEGEGAKSSDAWTNAPEVETYEKSGTVTAEEVATAGDKKALTTEEWQRDVINRLAFAAINEQRRTRRWNIFFKSLIFIYLAALLFYMPGAWQTAHISHGKHTALIDIDGVIAADARSSADNLIPALRKAFEDTDTRGIILRMNTPGGSPVQAGYINDEIWRLREKYPDIKVYAVIVDTCASAGYYIASAANEIYADKASLVGSIGVKIDSFGFVDVMKKVGVQRRLITAGKYKGTLDPFSPLKKSERQHLQNMLDGVHKQFIDVVKRGRGDKLKNDPDLFSGLFWNGDKAVELGLVDGLGSSSYVARDIIGAKNIVNYTPRENVLDRLANRFGAGVAHALNDKLGFQAVGGTIDPAIK
jgi:protease-4